MKNELQERLTLELDTLVDELTIDIPESLGEQQPPQSYRALTARQRAISERVRRLRILLEELPVLESGMVFRDRVGFGTEVHLEDLDTKERISYTLMSGDDINLEAGEISIVSPVGNALLGHRVGDEVEVVTPRRVRRLRVVEIVTLFDEAPGLPGSSDGPNDETLGMLQAMA